MTRVVGVARQGGFTLTELMTVVAIIAVLSTLAWSSMRTDARPADVASTTGNLVREAARKAVAGGVVRADVRIALGSPGRSRLRLFAVGADQYIVVEKLVERTTAAGDWYEVARQKMPRNNRIAGTTPSADLTGGTGPATAFTAEVQIPCTPDGLCQVCTTPTVCNATTIYFQDTRGPRRARVVMMPLGGSPAIFPSW